MKRQINLYGAEFRPRRQWASLNQMALAWGCALLLILLTGGGYGWQQQQVSQALAQRSAELELKRSEAQRLDAELARHQADPGLQQQLVSKQDELTAKQGLMRQLGSLTLQKSQGYASVMADLSRIRSGNLSLQRIEINEGRINLSGFAGRSQDVPAWVNRFKQTPSLVGKEFGELTLGRDKEGRLTFPVERHRAGETLMNLKAQWQAWGQRIALLSQRERVLILLTGLVLLGAAGIYGWLEGADTRLQQDRMALSAAERDLEIMELENLGKQARLKRDPNQGGA